MWSNAVTVIIAVRNTALRAYVAVFRGDCYYYGTGVSKSYADALKWFEKAAEHGNTRAASKLGDCYYYGNGVTSPRFAADKHDDIARLRLYTHHVFARGCAQTHNHPTEIEPFGGAATCLGGAIRDPLSGRA